MTIIVIKNIGVSKKFIRFVACWAILFILLTLFIAVGLAGADGQQDGKDGAGADGKDGTANTTLYNFAGHDFSLTRISHQEIWLWARRPENGGGNVPEYVEQIIFRTTKPTDKFRSI